MRRHAGSALWRQGDHLFDLRVADLARLAWMRGIEQSVQPLLDKSAPPLAHRLHRHPTTLRHLAVARRLSKQIVLRPEA